MEYFTLGAFESPLRQQLAEYLPQEKLHSLDRLSTAINLLTIHSIISDSESTKAKKRLTTKIQNEIAKQNKK